MSFLVELFAATPENPRFSLNDPSAWDALGAEPASSGMRVNLKTALTLPAVWRAANLLSSGPAKLPLFVYRRAGEGKDRDPSHPAYSLLRYTPNESMGAFVWKRAMQAQAVIKGNAYSYITRNGAGEPIELLPLDQETTYPVRANGVLSYVTTIRFPDGSQEMRRMAPEDVFHIKGFGFDGIMGLDLLTYARECLGLGLALQKYGSIFFKNSSRPNVVLLHPAKLTPEAADKLRERWERLSGGLENAHRTAVLDQGLTVKELTLNARESQLVEQKKLTLVDVANIWGVPVHKIGGEGRTAYASLEQENQSYLDDGLDPWLVQWEEEAREKLLTEEQKDKDTHIVEFCREALVRADLTARANYYRTALGGRGWMAPNEVRTRENLNESDEPDADLMLTPLNMGPGGAANEPAPATAPPAKKSAAPPPDESGDGPNTDGNDPESRQLAPPQRSMLEEMAGRMIRRVGARARRASTEPKKFLAWLDGMEAEFAPVVRGAVTLAMGAADLPDGSAAADSMLAKIRADLLEVSGQCTAADLVEQVDLHMRLLEHEGPGYWVAGLISGGAK